MANKSAKKVREHPDLEPGEEVLDAVWGAGKGLLQHGRHQHDRRACPGQTNYVGADGPGHRPARGHARRASMDRNGIIALTDRRVLFLAVQDRRPQARRPSPPGGRSPRSPGCVGRSRCCSWTSPTARPAGSTSARMERAQRSGRRRPGPPHPSGLTPAAGGPPADQTGRNGVELAPDSPVRTGRSGARTDRSGGGEGAVADGGVEDELELLGLGDLDAGLCRRRRAGRRSRGG